MAKAKTKQVFKQYSPNQNLLLPPNLEELIDSHHLVRVINGIVDSMDLTTILNSYMGGGTSAYHPRMMIKILLYAYAVKIYTGRRIAKALRQDITFMWLVAYNRPDFRTINNFRSGVLKTTIEELFKQMLDFLLTKEYIKFEHYFCDGSTFEADANRHKMVWNKNAKRYQAATEQKCRDLFKQIDQLNETEQSQYGNKDLEESGTDKQAVTKEQIAMQASKLDQVIETAASKRLKRKATTLKKKLSAHQDSIDKYERQQQISGSRSGYSATDEDATAMKMKNGEVLPGYNILIGSEDQFITGYSVHQKNNDGACFKDHVQQFKQHGGHEPTAIIADSIFGTQQNYEIMDDREIAAYVKFPLYHKERSHKYVENPFRKENFIYDAANDTYICPNNKALRFRYVKTDRNKNGYISFSRLYECESCQGCPFAKDCKGTSNSNRTIKVNQSPEHYKQQARDNLKSELGDELKRKRSIEVETCFGDIKKNQGFRRFHLRGKQKVKAEFGLIAIAHNLRKLHLKVFLSAA
ncbi:IS1182 family transposase [Chitinophaga rhizophila]|uniref:IS1182 family transposase n=1 Tax=Chitinophaga rhizophila TaxID=2866212 RepID=A0ABS7GJM2_9BACT|nr:IS1182 family transposase [Chitinophaga rhizophila]MBW8687911.1 IS1182 family transposase [Chitinophaga rhizophila]